MEFQLSSFKSWKMMLWKCCMQYTSKFGKFSSGPRTVFIPRTIFIPIPKKGNANEWSNYCTIVLISHASFPCGSAGKESTCNTGDLGSIIPGLGRSPGEGKGYPLQYSGLENYMNCIIHGVAKSWTRLSDFHFSFFHMLAKQCSKFSKPGFNSTWTVKFQMFKLDLEKAEEPEIKLPTSVGSSKKQESSRKTSISALTIPKPLTV